MGIRFAFDLGTNSLGFAVWRTGPDSSGFYGRDAPLELLWSGVRLFKDGRNPKDMIGAALRGDPEELFLESLAPVGETLPLGNVVG